MGEPKMERPSFPSGYLENPTGYVAWSRVVERLTEAKNYWLVSVRPGGRPHAVPVWGVWMADRFYFDGSPATRHARNIARSPQVVLHLESGDDVVIVEGIARAVPPPPAAAAGIAAEYSRKYHQSGYAPEPGQWDAGGLYQVRPQRVLAWSQFTVDPTRFTFEE